MSNEIINELNTEWPHGVLSEHPSEVHISPRTAYFTRNGKVMFMRLEELTDDAITDANERLAKEGVTP